MSIDYYDALSEAVPDEVGEALHAEMTENLEEGYWQAILEEGEYARCQGDCIEDFYRDVPQRNEIQGEYIVNSASTSEVAPEDEEADWRAVARIMDADEVLELTVIGYNRGGLLVEWRSLRGFVPASQLVDGKHEGDGSPQHHRQELLLERVGKRLSLRVIELDADKNRFILSERAAQVECGTRADILQKLDPGTIIKGCITNLCEFGAFVDLGGVEGLIHISELSWGRVGHPMDVLTRGQEVEVYVLDVDPDDARIALSLKRLHPDPWATVHERYRIGEVVRGTITNVVDFGAFACIENGLEGLIHFSELAEGHFLHPRNVVAEGDIVHARILSIDGRSRRLGLSLRMR